MSKLADVFSTADSILYEHINAMLHSTEARKHPSYKYWREIQACEMHASQFPVETVKFHPSEMYDPECGSCAQSGDNRDLVCLGLSADIRDSLQAGQFGPDQIKTVLSDWGEYIDAVNISNADVLALRADESAVQKWKHSIKMERHHWALASAVFFELVRPAICKPAFKRSVHHKDYVKMAIDFETKFKLRSWNRCHHPEVWCVKHEAFGHLVPTHGRGECVDYYEPCMICPVGAVKERADAAAAAAKIKHDAEMVEIDEELARLWAESREMKAKAEAKADK